MAFVAEAERRNHRINHWGRAVSASENLATRDQESTFDPQSDPSILVLIQVNLLIPESRPQLGQRIREFFVPRIGRNPASLAILHQNVVNVDQVSDRDRQNRICRHHRRDENLLEQQVVEVKRLVLVVDEEHV